MRAILRSRHYVCFMKLKLRSVLLLSAGSLGILMQFDIALFPSLCVIYSVDSEGYAEDAAQTQSKVYKPQFRASTRATTLISEGRYCKS
jgi:hypothetical protein